MSRANGALRRKQQELLRQQRAQQRLTQRPLGENLINSGLQLIKPAIDQFQRLQRAVDRATPWADGLVELAGKAMEADDKLPSSMVARGANELTQSVLQAANVDPRIGLAIAPLLIGRVSAGGVAEADGVTGDVGGRWRCCCCRIR